MAKRDQMGYSPEAAIAAKKEVLGAQVAAGDTSGLRGAVGTPDQIREYLRRYEEAGVDQVIFVMQAGRNRHEDIMSSLELFAAEVLPEFKERDPAASAAKAERIAPIVEAALARRVDDAPPMPDGYVMRAIPKAMVEAVDSDEGRQFLDAMAEKSAVGDEGGLSNLLGCARSRPAELDAIAVGFRQLLRRERTDCAGEVGVGCRTATSHTSQTRQPGGRDVSRRR